MQDPAHEAALAKLDAATAAQDVNGALEALYTSKVFDGLYATLRKKFPSLRNDADYFHVIGQAVDLFVDDMQARRRIDSPIGFIWRAAELKAQEESRRLRREQATDPNRLSGRIVSALPADPGPAIQEARRLLPRIRGDGARNVLALILDAMEAERQMLSNIEIAEILQMSVVNARQLRKRAFDRLILLAREEQKAGRGFHLPELDDDEELLVATDDIEGDEE